MLQSHEYLSTGQHASRYKNRCCVPRIKKVRVHNTHFWGVRDDAFGLGVRRAIDLPEPISSLKRQSSLPNDLSVTSSLQNDQYADSTDMTPHIMSPAKSQSRCSKNERCVHEFLLRGLPATENGLYGTAPISVMNSLTCLTFTANAWGRRNSISSSREPFSCKTVSTWTGNK